MTKYNNLLLGLENNFTFTTHQPFTVKDYLSRKFLRRRKDQE